MLRPKKPTKTPNFAVYDLEWYPHNLELRCCGFYDGECYWWFKSVPEFLEFALRRRFHGWQFFAHAGGSFDILFLLPHLQKYDVEIAFSGSSAVKVTVKRGRLKWEFCDSYHLLRTSLKSLGEAIGDHKSSCAFDAPLAELVDYNEQDCKVLYKALSRFSAQVEELGGSRRATIGSTAMNLFLTRYLKKPIKTSAVTNQRLRDCYVASRVEVFKKEVTESFQYDINSSFPFSLTYPMPANLKKRSKTIPDNSSTFFAYCKIYVPESYTPPIPYRYNGNLFFPHGWWDTWISYPDMIALQEAGGKVLKVYECLEYAEFNDTKAYVQDLYDKRVNSTDEYESLVYKYFLNSLYGKFGESNTKNAMCFGCFPPEDSLNSVEVKAGIWVYQTEKEIAHQHVPISIQTTAYSRLWLWRLLNGRDPAYCDTDCIVTKEKLPTSIELGGLKLEAKIEDMNVVGPKHYKIKGEFQTKGGGWVEKEVVKAKGFRRLSVDEYNGLLKGEGIKIERMARIKEGLRRFDAIEPRTVEIYKHIQNPTPKREFFAGGDSRAYHITEIPKLFEKRKKKS